MNSSNLIGQSFGRYHILEKLGEGGMATVYKAYDTRLETDVAVKVIRTENILPSVLERALKRFEREAKSLARLTHPNIVKVTDYGEFEGKPYLVMPYLPGGTLKQKLGKPIPWQEAAHLLIPIAEALDYAHSQNMIHRDVKPSNILLTQRGQPMLTDFGIAKVLDLEETQDLTGTSAAVGTPEYMAPEQATAKTVDRRADIYALGVVLYEMVTGRKPYIADTPMAVLIKQATEPLPRPKQYARNLPNGVEKVLLKALAKKPEDRYQSMAELVIALQHLLTGKSAVTEKRGEAELKAIDKQSQSSRRIEIVWPSVSRSSAVVIGFVVISILAVILLEAQLKHMPMTVVPTSVSNLSQAPSLATASISTKSSGVLGIGSNMISPKDGMTLMYVPAGSFQMGSNDISHAQIHIVYLNAFWIDKTDVTNKMYALCANAGVCKSPTNISSSTHSSYYDNSQYDSYPVIYVDWNMANTYCQWAGRQLPTEAQWEKAARGTDGRGYPWGNSIDCSLANYWEQYSGCVGDTTEVGKYPNGASPYGVLDMAGNVQQWVNDWYDANYYNNSPILEPLGPSSGQDRVLRGGSWGSNTLNIRSANRNWSDPSITGYYFGFRCSRSAP